MTGAGRRFVVGLEDEATHPHPLNGPAAKRPADHPVFVRGLMAADLAVVAGFSWNPLSDVSAILSWQFMRSAYEAGTVVAVVSGVVGYFVVLRRTAFAAHALSDMGFPGAAGAALDRRQPGRGDARLHADGRRRDGDARRAGPWRDTVVGIVLAFSLALGYLFSSLYTGNSTEAFALRFGQITGVTDLGTSP